MTKIDAFVGDDSSADDFATSALGTSTVVAVADGGTGIVVEAAGVFDDDVGPPAGTADPDSPIEAGGCVELGSIAAVTVNHSFDFPTTAQTSVALAVTRRAPGFVQRLDFPRAATMNHDSRPDCDPHTCSTRENFFVCPADLQSVPATVRTLRSRSELSPQAARPHKTVTQSNAIARRKVGDILMGQH
jgi:hypothetical protein